MLVTGTNGSQLWDTAFAAQALVETGLADIEENKASTLKMLKWLDEAQIRENPKHFHTAYRQATKGAWYAAISRSSYGALNGCLEIAGPSAQRSKAIRSRTVPAKLSRPFFTSKIGGSKPGLTALVLVLTPAQRLPKTDFRCPYIRFGGSADNNAVHQWWLWQLRDPPSAEDSGVFERGRSIRLVPLLLLLKNN
jgi:hypothetical protein